MCLMKFLTGAVVLVTVVFYTSQVHAQPQVRAEPSSTGCSTSLDQYNFDDFENRINIIMPHLHALINRVGLPTSALTLANFQALENALETVECDDDEARPQVLRRLQTSMGHGSAALLQIIQEHNSQSHSTLLMLRDVKRKMDKLRHLMQCYLIALDDWNAEEFHEAQSIPGIGFQPDVGNENHTHGHVIDMVRNHLRNVDFTCYLVDKRSQERDSLRHQPAKRKGGRPVGGRPIGGQLPAWAYARVPEQERVDFGKKPIEEYAIWDTADEDAPAYPAQRYTLESLRRMLEILKEKQEKPQEQFNSWYSYLFRDY